MSDDTDSKQPTTAPFNLGIATLMRINDILQDITNIEKKTGIIDQQHIGDRLPDGLALNIKYKLVWQLFSQSTPLLDEEQQEEIQEELKQLQPQPKENDLEEYQYSSEADLELNKIIITIQRKLQDNGSYFMPSKNDPNFALTEE